MQGDVGKAMVEVGVGKALKGCFDKTLVVDDAVFDDGQDLVEQQGSDPWPNYGVGDGVTHRFNRYRSGQTTSAVCAPLRMRTLRKA